MPSPALRMITSRRRGCAGRRAAILGVLCLLAACGETHDPILQLLDELAAAAEARDAGRIHARLAEGFEGTGGLDRSEAQAVMRRYFTAYETVDVELYDVSIDRAETTQVRFRVEFSGQVRRIGALQAFLPPSASYRFTLRLVNADGEWRVARADWEPLPPPGS